MLSRRSTKRKSMILIEMLPRNTLLTSATWLIMECVKPLMMKPKQADYLDTFSNDAQLFYLAFPHVDGTDGERV
jgi:hypothetical protein